jgi:hypothetical protein
MGLGNGGTAKTKGDSDPTGMRYYDTARQGMGRRATDNEVFTLLQDLVRNRVAWWIITTGFTALSSIIAWQNGYVTGVEKDKEQFRASTLALLQEKVSSDTNQKLDDARRAATEALANGAHNDQQIQTLRAEVADLKKMMVESFTKLTAEVKKGNE